ncbi:hypothetical protein [Phaeodactylibacter xiamenensis]|uniref:PglD-related sugar-binding protein n=1 Tax=Phaeodactylibacter xiamenensis TaxID=1524460 RepID=UPI0024A827ED|nr:hypothetical protein [Phaeodactylibacter xiamenensis]
MKNSTPTSLHLIGAGGLGREIAATLFHPIFQNKYPIAGFIDDKQKPGGTLINTIPVLGNLEWLKKQEQASAMLCIGKPEIRQQVLSKLSGLPIDWPTIIHPGATLYDAQRIQLGKGIFIGQGSILTTDIHVGDHSFIQPGCSLHHDTRIGQNCILMPGVRITGGANITDHTYIPAGTCITNAITV